MRGTSTGVCSVEDIRTSAEIRHGARPYNTLKFVKLRPSFAGGVLVVAVL